MRAGMTPYANRDGHSGVKAFAVRGNHIDIEFVDGKAYHYDDLKPGQRHVEAMKRLAHEGRGLATYINKHVRKNYARKL